MPDDDRVSAELVAIRERRANSMIGGLFRPTVAQLDLDADDLPRLLAAVEVVLKLAGDAEVWQRATLYCNCADCHESRHQGGPALHEPPAVAWTLDPARIGADIERALTGGADERG